MASSPSATPAPVLVFAHGATWDRRYQVSSLAATATAAGDRVDLCLFFAALDAWVRDDWDRLDPAPPVDAERLEELAFPPLSNLVDGARETGLLRLYACSASVRMLDLPPARVQARVDALLGWQSFSRMIAEAGRVVTF